MKNSIGTNVILTLFGESHGPAVGAVIDGLPAGSKVTLYDIRGRQVLTHSSNHFNNSTLPAGIYMLKAITPSGALHTAKIIIKH